MFLNAREQGLANVNQFRNGLAKLQTRQEERAVPLSRLGSDSAVTGQDQERAQKRERTEVHTRARRNLISEVKKDDTAKDMAKITFTDAYLSS